MHTQGKLRIGEYRDIVTESGEKLEIIGVSMPCGNVPPDDPCHHNARRLVACWNACEGIDTETLEAGHEPVTADYLREICHEYGKLTNGKDDPDWGWFVNGNKYGPYLKMDRKRCEVWTSIHTFFCHVDDRQQLSHLLLGMKVKTAVRGEVTA